MIKEVLPNILLFSLGKNETINSSWTTEDIYSRNFVHPNVREVSWDCLLSKTCAIKS